MFKFEMYKALRKKELIIFIVIGVIIEIFMASQDNKVIPGDLKVNIYREYIDEVKGDYTEEKNNWLISESERFQKYLEDKTVYEEKYNNGEIDANEYKDYLDNYKEADAKFSTLNYVIVRSSYLGTVAQDGKNAEYFYDLDMDDYIGNMGVDIVVVLLITVFVVHIFGEDYNCGTDIIVKTCEKGRKILFIARLKCTLIISTIIGTIFPIIEFIIKNRKFSLEGMSASVSCLTSMQESTLSMNIKQYLILCTIIRSLAAVLFSIIVMCITVFIKNTIADYVVAVAFVYLPYLIYDSVAEIINRLSFCKGLGVYKGFSSPQKMFGIHGMIIWFIIYVLAATGIIFILRKKKFKD